MTEDAEGNMWFGTDHGVFKKPKNDFAWEHYGTAEGLVSNEVSEIFCSRDGEVLATFPCGGLKQYHPLINRWVDQEMVPLPFTLISDFQNEPTGGFWVSTLGGGLALYKDNAWEIRNEASGLPFSSVSSLTLDHEGNLWGAGSGGIFRKTDSVFTYVDIQGGPSQTAFWFIAADREGKLYAMGDSGLYVFSGNSFSKTEIPDGLVPGQVNDLKADEGGNIALATDLGLFQWNGTSWEKFSTNEGLAASECRSLFVSSGGALIISHKGSYSKKTGQKIGVTLGVSGFTSDRVQKVYSDHFGKIWVLSYHKLFRFEGTDWIFEKDFRNQVYNPDPPCAMASDPDGVLFVLIESKLFSFNGKSWDSSYNKNGLYPDLSGLLFCDQEGKVWVSTLDGVSSIFKGAVKNFSFSNSEFRNKVKYSFAEDGTGRFLVNFGGCAAVSTGSQWALVEYPQGTGLVSEVYYAPLGFSVFSGSKGLSVFNGVDLKFLNGKWNWKLFPGGRDNRLLVFNPEVSSLASNPYVVPLEVDFQEVNDASWDLKGNVWLGTERALLNGSPVFPTPETLPLDLEKGILVAATTPFKNTFSFKLKAEQATLVSWEVRDVKGICLHSENETLLEEGLHDFQLSWDGLPAGLYFLNVSWNRQIISKKVVKIN